MLEISEEFSRDCPNVTLLVLEESDSSGSSIVSFPCSSLVEFPFQVREFSGVFVFSSVEVLSL